MIKILFLGYSKKETRLIDFLKSNKNIQLSNYNKKINKSFIKKFNKDLFHRIQISCLRLDHT